MFLGSIRRILIIIPFVMLGFHFGCGGDDAVAPDPEPEPEPVPTVDLAGSVLLPDTWSGSPEDLAVLDVLAVTDVAEDGAFNIPVHEDLTQLGLVLGQNGDPILYGWLDAEHTELSVRSTAEFLVWSALGAWMVPSDGGQAIRTFLADPQLDLDLVETAWTAMLESSPAGLTEANASVQEAVQTVVLGLLTPPEKGLIIEPGLQQSGVEVLNHGGINKITIKNSYRRRAAGFLWKTGYRDTNDVLHEFPDPVLVQEMELPPVAGFAGTLNTILSAIIGGVAYEPVVMEPILLETRDDAKRDFYRFNVLGMGLEEPDNPELYSSHERAQGEWMAMKCLCLDYFLPMFLNTAGAAGTTADRIFGDNIPGQVNDFISLVTTNFPVIYQEATAGHFWPALHEMWNTTLTNGTMQEWVRNLVAAGLVEARFTAAEAGAVMEGVNRAFLYIGIVDIIGNVADNMITGYHFGLCKKAESWDLTATSPVIHLEPRGAELMAYGYQGLRLVIDDDTGEHPAGWTYAYHWYTDGRHGTLIDPNDPLDTSNDWYTSAADVDYVADKGSEGTETIHCDLYVALGGTRTLVQEAICELSIIRQHIVLSDTMQTCPDGIVEFRPHLHPPYEGSGQILWSYSGGGTNGDLRGPANETPPWTSTSNAATFRVDGDGGNDWVTCIASVELENMTVSPIDTVEVFIEDVSAFEPYAGTHYCYTNFVNNNGSCSAGFRIVIAFDEIPGVRRYRVQGTGFNDPWWYGSGYDAVVNASSLERRNGQFIIGLTSGGGSADCDDPPSDAELCSQMWRFEGAIWTISPICP